MLNRPSSVACLFSRSSFNKYPKTKLNETFLSPVSQRSFLLSSLFRSASSPLSELQWNPFLLKFLNIWIATTFSPWGTQSMTHKRHTKYWWARQVKDFHNAMTTKFIYARQLSQLLTGRDMSSIIACLHREEMSLGNTLESFQDGYHNWKVGANTSASGDI